MGKKQKLDETIVLRVNSEQKKVFQENAGNMSRRLRDSIDRSIRRNAGKVAVDAPEIPDELVNAPIELRHHLTPDQQRQTPTRSDGTDLIDIDTIIF